MHTNTPCTSLSACSDLVVALTAASAATSLAVVVLDDQAVIDRIAWAERQRALPSAQAAGAVAAALAERDRLELDGQLQVGLYWGCAAVRVCCGWASDTVQQRDVQRGENLAPATRVARAYPAHCMHTTCRYPTCTIL
jgi:hypothetical protein